ncbi:MAG: DUF4388 domain-containing protein [Chloroflexaceae bacterium]
MFLQGSFSTISAAALIQTLCNERRAVQIEAWRDKATACICLEEGVVIAAQCEGHEGPEAIFRLVDWPDGLFRVVRLPVNVQPTMAIPPEELLLEAARRRDERPG